MTDVEHQWTSLGGFGGPIAKPTMLVGTAPWMWKLYGRQPKNLTWDEGLYWVVSKDSHGRKMVTGTKALKGTEHYPVVFCHSFFCLWQADCKRQGTKRARHQ